MTRPAIRLALPVLAVLGGPALADQIVLPLPKGVKAETLRVAYDCGAFGRVAAQYVNAPPVALASLSFKGEFVVAANVIAASGARYAGGKYIWWTKGNSADLYDVTLGEGAAPVASCTSTG
ncbi:MliC family protein [Ancylobacter polymorphus]|uniref:MliC family protein n=1 Tax=Ancylobacter polymorphus TaxID=223390 RepID=A0A9E7D749_9HYPH|nr:MliC family protein [Ancylobacter polymorphus]UOK73040.1 MliC family protein [Ancylobacter polymorphus]